MAHLLVNIINEKTSNLNKFQFNSLLEGMIEMAKKRRCLPLRVLQRPMDQLR